MIHGIFYGILITYIIYFGGYAIRQKNRPALWLSFVIACTGTLIFLIHGDLQKILKSVMSEFDHALLISVIGLLFFTAAKFLRTFLNISLYSRQCDLIMHVLQWAGFAFIPMNLMHNPVTPIFNILLAGIGPVFSSLLAGYFWIRKIPNAGTFAVGWILGQLTYEVFLLIMFGVMPWIPANLYILPGAMIISVVFFGIAVTAQSSGNGDLAYKDNLTGIANRRLFEQALAIEWNRNLRSQQPLSVMMANIDDFQAYNDTYGYSQGDECLKAAARIFNQYPRRAGDLSARYGKNEFIAVLPDTLASEASFLAEKIRDAFENLAIKHETAGSGKMLTISLGTYTMIPNSEKSPEDLIAKANDALFQAKNAGKNRVVSIDEIHEQE